MDRAASNSEPIAAAIDAAAGTSAFASAHETGTWVLAAQAGDREAFAELHRRYHRLVHGLLLASLSPADAEDLAQEVFLHALRKLPDLREPAAFGSWLATIARNFRTNHFRGRHQRHLGAEPVTESNGGQTHAQAAAQLQSESEILDAVRRLPATYCETLMLRLVEGLTGPEIAAQTGLAAASVRVNLCRGMKLLREELGPSYFTKKDDDHAG